MKDWKVTVNGAPVVEFETFAEAEAEARRLGRIHDAPATIDGPGMRVVIEPLPWGVGS